MFYFVGPSVVDSQRHQCNNGYSVNKPNQGTHTCNNNIDITASLQHSDKYVYHNTKTTKTIGFIIARNK